MTEPELYIIDLDDTIVDTTRCRGKELELVPGVDQFFAQRSATMVLLTAGDRDNQLRKLSSLELHDHFDEILIVETPQDKKGKIKQLVERSMLDPAMIMVIGDRLDIELDIGIELGCTTVRIRRPHGNYSHLMHLPDAGPTHTCADFHELLQLL